jgi:hypothetical protein
MMQYTVLYSIWLWVSANYTIRYSSDETFRLKVIATQGNKGIWYEAFGLAGSVVERRVHDKR